MHLPRRHQAGRSARRLAHQERRAWLARHRWFTRVVLALAAASYAISLPAAVVWKYPLGLIGGAALSLWLYMRDASPAAQRFLDGADGERRTEHALRALAGEGWIIRHDLAATHGNVDHIAVGPAGVYLLDSKNWTGQVSLTDGVPHVHRPGRYPDPIPLRRIPGQLRAAAAEQHAVLRTHVSGRLWVHPVVVLWADFDARAVEAGGVAYVHGDALVDWLRSRPAVHSTAQVQHIAAALHLLPLADTGAGDPSASPARADVRDPRLSA